MGNAFPATISPLTHPAVLVNYRFTGFLDEVFSTLVVRLHHTEPFRQDQFWRCVADFRTNTEKHLVVELTRRAPGVGELEVFSDPAVATEEKFIPREPEQGTRVGGRGYSRSWRWIGTTVCSD